MGTLHVHLENGFEHDRVVVRTGHGEHVEPDATTRYQIGLASVIALDVPNGRQCELSVALPDRGLTAVTALDPVATPHVRIDVRGGQLLVRASADPPRLA